MENLVGRPFDELQPGGAFASSGAAKAIILCGVHEQMDRAANRKNRTSAVSILG